MANSSYSIDDFLKSAIIIPEVHLHLFYAGFAFVVRVGLRVQQDGNHLVGEAVFRKTADAYIPLAAWNKQLDVWTIPVWWDSDQE